MGSDLNRDGMYLELNCTVDGEQKYLAEIFYLDEKKVFELCRFDSCEIPFEILEEFINEAKKRLPEEKNKNT